MWLLSGRCGERCWGLAVVTGGVRAAFDAPPTQGYCEGGYVWHIEKGKFGKVPLDGLTWSWIGHSPGALHKGNVTWLVLADEKATAEQRAAFAKIAEGATRAGRG